MEVVAPSPEFHFHTAMNTPYISAPSSPQNHLTKNSPFFESLHHRHLSAPNSPTSAAASAAAAAGIYAAGRNSRHSSVPFDWEEKPGTPKSPSFDEKDDAFDFEFDFSFSFGFSDRRQIEKASPPGADELFESGKIRPLKLPPRLYAPVMGEQGPKSPRSGGGLLSPLRRGRFRREKDPFVLAMVEATRSRKGGSRSLSPFGGRGKGGSFLSGNPPLAAEKGGRGWKSRLKELLLFRSSSEGRRASGEGKRNDFSKCGSLSSSSSASSNSSAKGKSGCGESSCSSFRSEEKQSVVFSVRRFAAGKFGPSFVRRWT